MARPSSEDTGWSAEAVPDAGQALRRLERDALLDLLARELDRAATAAGIGEDA
jgi:hypothetical protein